MDFNNLDDIKKSGFAGFMTIEELLNDNLLLPIIQGVYLVLYCEENSPLFLEEGTGGHFNGNNPNVLVDRLEENWVGNTLVIYIGKAGNNGANATLRSRLIQYLSFGQGNNIGHWGGRFIWQLPAPNNLVICWKTLPDEIPRTFEANLIQEFKIKFNGKRPFANLKD